MINSEKNKENNKGFKNTFVNSVNSLGNTMKNC